MTLLLGACQQDILDPPRLATQTAQAQIPPTPTLPPFFSAAPTPTAGSQPGIDIPATPDLEGSQPEESLTLWVNETSDDHFQALESMAEAFTAQSGIELEVVLVSSQLLPELVQTAIISATLPDLLLHPAEFSIGWANKGILDASAATEVLDALGRNTFDPQAIEMVTMDTTGTVAALPSDGYQQLIIYRADWFAEQGLDPPDNYKRLITAAETFYEPDSLISGLVVPTDSALFTTQQIFEFIAAANGCELVDDKGQVTLLHPACLEALDYYRELINLYSPFGMQTDISALNTYLAGRTAIIFSSPAVLPALAGLDERFRPLCPECASEGYLARNSGFLTRLDGRGVFSSTANFGEVTNLGITGVADKEAAKTFAAYFFGDGYNTWLGVNPERKVPLRWGTTEQPTLYLDQWGETPLFAGGPSLLEIYGQEFVDRLSQNVVTPSRWGFDQGQGALVTTIYEELVLSPLLQEMLSGYFTSSQTIIEIYRAVTDLIPGYAFPLESEPTQVP